MSSGRIGTSLIAAGQLLLYVDKTLDDTSTRPFAFQDFVSQGNLVANHAWNTLFKAKPLATIRVPTPEKSHKKTPFPTSKSWDVDTYPLGEKILDTPEYIYNGRKHLTSPDKNLLFVDDFTVMLHCEVKQDFITMQRVTLANLEDIPCSLPFNKF